MREKIIESFIEEMLSEYILEDEDFTDVTRKTNLVKKAPQPQREIFDLEKLRTLQSLTDIFSYLQSTMENAKIGAGQGRTVYKLGNGQVLKVANDQGGIEQNKAESIACSGFQDLFPRIFEIQKTFLWMIVAEATMMEPNRFQQITKMPWDKFISGLKGAFPEKLKNPTPQQLESFKQNFIDLSGNPFFKKVIGAIKSCKYEPGDIAKLDSWGVVQGKPVIIDSGFTEAVSQQFYKENKNEGN